MRAHIKAHTAPAPTTNLGEGREGSRISKPGPRKIKLHFARGNSISGWDLKSLVLLFMFERIPDPQFNFRVGSQAFGASVHV